MDHILEGTLLSDKPKHLKSQLCHKVEELGCTHQQPATVHAVLNVALRLSLENPERYIVEACKKIYLVWGRHNHAVLENYFSLVLLQKLLNEQVRNQKEAIWFIHQTMLIIRSDKPQFMKLCKVMQSESIIYLTHYPAYETVTGLCRFLTDFRNCIPQNGKLIAFCNSLITATGTFEAPKIPELITQYVIDVTHLVGGLLSYIWKTSDVSVIVKSLHQIFSIISHVHDNRVPSLALAGTVPHIPTDIMDSVVKQTVSDPSIPDRNIQVALGRMLDWLTWPDAKHLDSWIIAFFQGLTSVHKYTIVMEVIETKIEHVYEKLHFIPMRESAFAVLMHMLLSYQHSPEPFHKIVLNVPKTIMMWRSEQSEASYDLMCRFSRLLHTLMAHHLGFPELYEHVMDVIKDLPKPSSEEIKETLEKYSWKSSQNTNKIFSVGNMFGRRSETGKTGLVNLGNTCYMNSVLQALYMCDSFCQEVLMSSPSKHQPLLSKLRCVFGFLTATQRPAYAPSTFLTASRPPWFTAGLQQDCSEFMRYLYDQMHEQELTRLKSEVDTSASGVTKHLTKMVKDESSTLISRMFMGKIVTTFKCLACYHESKHTESFTDLSLAFPEDIYNKSAVKTKNLDMDNQRAALVGGAVSDKSARQNKGKEKEGPLESVVTLDDLLAHYLRLEKLKGDNKYYCDVCKQLQDGERFIHIISPPEYLNLTLLRFSYSVKAKARSKIFTDVSYPKTLHLPVCKEEEDKSISEPSSDFSERIKKSKTVMPIKVGESSVTYSLCAVIVHSGYSSDSGHYYCYARHNTPVGSELQNISAKQQKHKMEHTGNEVHDQDFLPDQWYLFNDSRVTYSHYESFSNITRKFGKDTPYVLFYKRIYPEVLNQSAINTLGEAPLPADLRTIVDQDNRLFLQEQELAERSRHLQVSSQSNASFYRNWKDPDDRGPPGSCGGGGGGGLSTNRLVF